MGLEERIRSRTAQVAVVGLGYAGLPLAVALGRAGFSVTGLERDREKVRLLERGASPVPDVPAALVVPELEAGRLRASLDPAVLADADVAILCVQTPLNKTRDPDIRYIVEAVDDVCAHQHAGMLVVLESTTYPGTTSEVLVPKLTGGGFELGRDVFVAFSPERVDPGNERFRLENTPKIIAGATPECLRVATLLYSHVIETLVPVSSTEAAELAKLLENTFRAVNVGLVNEMALVSRRLGIDPFEVIRAAATKPFGFMPFYPGPGLGGHCIPVDPLYLSWKLRSLEHEARFIDLADRVNAGMPGYVVQRVADALNDVGRAVRGARVLVVGVAYKPDVHDVRESPALAILAGLRNRGARVEYLDDRVPVLREAGLDLESIDPSSSFADHDVVVIVTAHSSLDRGRLLAEARLVVDTRDALHGVAGDRSKVRGL